jgi:glycosyltransferase involved in cell wall biosynthesis
MTEHARRVPGEQSSDARHFANMNYVSGPPPSDDGRLVSLEAELEKLRARHAKRGRRIAKLNAEREHAVREAALLRDELDKARLHRYGAYGPGVKGWEGRWDENPGRRVLLYARTDAAGSLFRWTEAINRHTAYAARMACFHLNPFEFSTDLVFPNPRIDSSGFAELVAEADLVHVKDERRFPRGEGLGGQAGLAADKPVVFTHYDRKSQHQADDPDYRRAVGRCAARVATTPDLCFDWFDGRWVPLPVDTERFSYEWRDGRVVGHSPTVPERKGTREFMEAASTLPCDIELIQDVSHAECLERKRRCNLFFDQAGRDLPRFGGQPIGSYGNSALEAMVHGIPTVAHLGDEAFAGAVRGGKDIRADCPIINAPLGVEGIRATLGRWLDAPADERHRRSRETRAWVERVHSYRAVAADLAAVYDGVLAPGP